MGNSQKWLHRFWHRRLNRAHAWAHAKRASKLFCTSPEVTPFFDHNLTEGGPGALILTGPAAHFDDFDGGPRGRSVLRRPFDRFFDRGPKKWLVLTYYHPMDQKCPLRRRAAPVEHLSMLARGSAPAAPQALGAAGGENFEILPKSPVPLAFI